MSSEAFELFMWANTSKGFWVGYGGGWPGVILVQAEPFNTNALVNCVPQGVTHEVDGTFRLWFTMTNYGPNATQISVQLASE